MLDGFNCTFVSHKKMPYSKPQADGKLLTVPLEKLHLIIEVLFLLNIKIKQSL